MKCKKPEHHAGQKGGVMVRPTKEDIREALEELERVGLVRKTRKIPPEPSRSATAGLRDSPGGRARRAAKAYARMLQERGLPRA